MSLIIEWLFPKKCLGCGGGEKYLCSLCESKMQNGLLTKRKGFEGIISVYKYDALMKKIVEKIKYEFVSEIIEELAQLIVKKMKLDYPNIIKYWRDEKFCLIPIPLHWQRKNWRGFNQSEVLASNLAKILGLEFRNDVLVRNVKTKNQAAIKNRELRRKNIINVFGIEKKEMLPLNIVLVDDVITSGATMTAAQKILKDSGIRQVWGLSLCGVQK